MEEEAGQEKTSKRLFVGNISFKTTNDELRKVFEEYGDIEEIKVCAKRGGKPAGYAFVSMKNSEDADKALAGISGREIDGREVRVEVASGVSKPRDRDDRGDRRGGGDRDRDRRRDNRDRSNGRRRSRSRSNSRRRRGDSRSRRDRNDRNDRDRNDRDRNDRDRNDRDRNDRDRNDRDRNDRDRNSRDRNDRRRYDDDKRERGRDNSRN